MTPHVSARHHAGVLSSASRGKVPIRSLTRSHHSSTDKLVSWFLQLSLLAVWKSLTTLSAPVARVLAVYVWAGKSVLKICSWATRLVLKLTGWLSSPAFPHSKWIRQWTKHLPWPLDVRKWHVVVGGSSRQNFGPCGPCYNRVPAGLLVCRACCPPGSKPPDSLGNLDFALGHRMQVHRVMQLLSHS